MGCGSSFPILSSIINKKNKSEILKNNFIDKSNRLPPINSQVKQIRNSIETKQKRLDNFEPLTLVYLDDDFDENDQEFRSIIDHLHCFNDLEECEQFILNNNNKFDNLFFIVSNQYATNIVSHIHDLKQIIAIYIFQQNKFNTYNRRDVIDERWTKRYTKVRGIYIDRDGLLEELSSDVKMHLNIGDLLSITIYSRLDSFQINNCSTDHLRFLFYQLFVNEYCLNSSSSSLLSSKKNFFNIIENYYQSNQYELDEIFKFNNEYNLKTKNILKWFLHETFLRRLLTKSLLILNLKILFALRFFIKDMFKIMIDLGLSTNQYRSSNQRIFYRSQILSEETFIRIKSNIGELISINDFFLANQNRHDSLANIRQYISLKNYLYRILFEIEIPLNYKFHKQRPFIDIDHLISNTILFFIGSIFRINTVVFDINNDCWIIQICLYDERINKDFSQLFTFLNDNNDNNNNSIILANLLRQISPKSAEDFYRHILKENSETFSRLECYRGLGLCSYSCEDYEKALTYFEKALEMKPNDELMKSSLHNSIGLVYAQQDDIDQAYFHFSQALKTSSLPLYSACAHHNLGLISSRKGLYDEELDHYQEAFQIRMEQLPSNHLQMASLFNNIGIAYSDMHQYDQALSNLKKALEMRLKLLSDTHIDVARSYANIGTVYAQTQEFQMALEYFTKAQLLFEKQLIIPEQDIKQTNKNIKIVNDKLRRKTC